MVRRFALALVLLAAITLDAHARGGGGHGSHGGHAHHGHHQPHFHRFVPFAAFAVVPVFPQFPYGYPCLWEEGHWETQLYWDKCGNYTYAPGWVPGEWLCP
ncbi:MAG TPA: hypothetical protein VMS64_14295 [Candidatus Methylomirabilis sp.]|nr:hypothetical protein [Candidatus Methylomirabilis sp.]